MICLQILEYHPQMLDEYMKGGEQISFLYPRYSIALAFPSKTLRHYHGNREGQRRTKFTLHFVFP
jgi:hypothetical protein